MSGDWQPDSTTYRRTDCRLQCRGCSTSIAYRRFDTPEVITAYVVNVSGVEVPGKAAVAADQATAGRTDGRTCLQHCRMYSSDSAHRRLDTRIQTIRNKQVAVTPFIVDSHQLRMRKTTGVQTDGLIIAKTCNIQYVCTAKLLTSPAMTIFRV